MQLNRFKGSATRVTWKNVKWFQITSETSKNLLKCISIWRIVKQRPPSSQSMTSTTKTANIQCTLSQLGNVLVIFNQIYRRMTKFHSILTWRPTDDVHLFSSSDEEDNLLKDETALNAMSLFMSKKRSKKKAAAADKRISLRASIQNRSLAVNAADQSILNVSSIDNQKKVNLFVCSVCGRYLFWNNIDY